MHDTIKHTVESTLTYTAENGVVFYIVGMKACLLNGDVVVEVVYTRNKSVVGQAMSDYEWAESVPIECCDEIVTTLSELRHVLEVRSHEKPHIGYVVIEKSDSE